MATPTISQSAIPAAGAAPAGSSSAPNANAAASNRTDALAARRREAVAERTAAADAARARASQELAATREAIARAIGANTRLSITRSDAPGAFVYQAIDVDTGEVVHQWPQGAFLQLVQGVREDVNADVQAGLLIDQSV